MKEFLVVLTSLLALAVLAFWAGFIVGVNEAMYSPNWACEAEDEIVVINNTCRHIDEIGR